MRSRNLWIFITFLFINIGINVNLYSEDKDPKDRKKAIEIKIGKEFNEIGRTLDEEAMEYLIDNTITASGPTVAVKTFKNIEYRELSYIKAISEGISAFPGEKVTRRELKSAHRSIIVPGKISLNITSQPKGATVICSGIELPKKTPIEELRLVPNKKCIFTFHKEGYKRKLEEYVPNNWELKQKLAVVLEEATK